tara:strand:- start:4553 stop:5197 length:645 start_codon:yes stop_codon:yes gene_type:complete
MSDWRLVYNIEALYNKYNLVVNGICHVGGWKATEVSTYKKVFGNIPITFIEANKALEPSIQKSIEGFNNVEYKIIAAGSHRHTTILHLDSGNNGQSSSLYRPKKHLQMYPTIKFNNTVEVDVKPVDEIMSGKVFNFLSIDVQGYELEVLKGSIESLTNVDYIIVEINKAEMYENCPMVEDLDLFLTGFGFIRKETGWWNNSEMWGDALYIKEST